MAEVHLTQEGLKELEDKLNYLKNIRRVEIAEQISDARAQGDLSENAEYDAAKELQAKNEYEIAEIEAMLKNVVVIDESVTQYETVEVGATVKVKNVGDRAGKTVVQLYVGDVESSVFRPVRELKGFEKVELQPGEEKDVSFTLDKRAFAYWNTQIHDWHVESGAFRIEIGYSSRDIAASAEVRVGSTVRIPQRYDRNSIILDILADPKGREAIAPLMEAMSGFFSRGEKKNDAADTAISEEMNMAMFNYMPLRTVLSFAGDKADPALLDQLLEKLNA